MHWLTHGVYSVSANLTNCCCVCFAGTKQLQVFFHNFFREKAERDRARGLTSASAKRKKAAAAAAAAAAATGKGGRRRRMGDDEDDPDGSFMVDDMADEGDDIAGLADGDDPEEEVRACAWVRGCVGLWVWVCFFSSFFFYETETCNVFCHL